MRRRNRSTDSPPNRSPVPAFVLMLLLMASAIVLYVQRYPLIDWWRLRGYTPPAAIGTLASQDTMTGYTRHLFYLNRPQLLTTVKSFRGYCPENKDTIVLGCYHPEEAGIYIYDIKDATLAGVTQVTAAHEVLHAVYTRLSSGDRSKLNALLQDYYDHGLTDQRVKDEIAIYKQTEPQAVLDEMNSTFGTEVAALSPELEAHYAKYFTDRQQIVAFGAQYLSAFSSRQQQIKDDDAKLTALKQQITSEKASVQATGDAIDNKRARLDALLNAGQSTEYNAAVPDFNAQVAAYNSALTALKQDIATYNELVGARNTTAGQLTTLASALDTRVPDKKSN